MAKWCASSTTPIWSSSRAPARPTRRRSPRSTRPRRSCGRPRLCPSKRTKHPLKRRRPVAERTTARRLLDAIAPYLVTLAVAAPFALVCGLLLRGDDVHWRYQWAFLALTAVPLAAWVAFHLERRRSGTLSFSRTHELR